MNNTNPILNDISKARVIYERELAATHERYEREEAQLSSRIKALNSADYHSDIISKYKNAYDDVALFCRKYADVRSKSLKLNFDMSKALTATSPRAITRGGVDGYFDKLIDEATAAVNALMGSPTVYSDESMLRTLCSVCADLGYIVANARRLLDESGIPERRRKEATSPVEAELASTKAAHIEAVKLENMQCYEQICDLRTRASELIERTAREKLGAYTPKPKEKLSVVLAYELNDISLEDAGFIESILGCSADALRETPIYYNVEEGAKAIVINAREEYFNTEEFGDIIENIFYTFASNLPKNCLNITGVDCGLTPKVASLAKTAAQINANIASPAVLISGSDITRYASELYKEAKQRSIDMEDIFEYNRKQQHAPAAFKLVYVNEYPAGFEGYREQSKMHVLTYLSEYATKVGIIPIICQDADSSNYDDKNAPKFKPEDTFFINLTAKDGVTVNGKRASLKIRREGFTEDAYWRTLEDYYKKAQDIFYLDDVLSRSDIIDEPLYPSFKIHVPLGIVDDKTYNYTFKAGNIEHTLIIGGSDAGKSSLLHAIILSMAYRYSPEEVEFYLADFKVGDQSPEFSNYERMEYVSNLYIPHIKYLQTRCAPTDAIDMFATVKNLFEQRVKFFREHDSVDYRSYHEKNWDAISRGELPKVPMTFFIIDEYHRIIEAAENSKGDLSERIASSIKALLNTIRSAGIALVLVDQDMKRTTSDIFGNGNDLPNRIVIGEMSQNIIKRLYYANTLYPDEAVIKDVAYLADKNFKGRLMIGNSQSHTNLRVAFVGKSTSDRARALADKIREKYRYLPNGEPRKCFQVLGGSEKCFRVSEDMESYRIAHAHRAAENSYMSVVEDYSVAIGVSSTGAAPVRLEYELKQNKGPAYTAVADEATLATIVRNTMLAFLYRTAGHYSYKGARIEYCAKPRDSASALKMYRLAMPWLDKHINIVGDFVEMSRTILRLAKLYDEREEYADSVESTDFEPVLLVIHNAEWIDSKKALPDSTAAPKPATPIPQDSSLSSGIDESAALLASAGLGGIALPAGMINSLAASGTQEKREDEFEYFTHQDLKEAFKKLYTHGNRYNIYMLVGTQDEEAVDKITGDSFNVSKSTLKHRIYSEERDGESAEFCYVTTSQNSEGSKTRLYHYSPDTEGVWWQELYEKLNGGI